MRLTEPLCCWLYLPVPPPSPREELHQLTAALPPGPPRGHAWSRPKSGLHQTIASWTGTAQVSLVSMHGSLAEGEHRESKCLLFTEQ